MVISPAAGPVAVTGVSGFTGGWMVTELVAHGYTVHACLRDQKGWRGLNATEYLQSLGESVTVFDGCDLFVPGSFDDAFKGCSAVFHVGHTYTHTERGGGGLRRSLLSLVCTSHRQTAVTLAEFSRPAQS